MAKRTRSDPSLLPEARMERMREELYLMRRTVISLVPLPYRKIVSPPYHFTREGGHSWECATAEKVIGLVKPDTMGRSACPLCGETKQPYGDGFKVPGGLERHLLGSHGSQQCGVMRAATGLLRVHHRELYPDDFGPYGCD